MNYIKPKKIRRNTSHSSDSMTCARRGWELNLEYNTSKLTKRLDRPALITRMLSNVVQRNTTGPQTLDLIGMRASMQPS